MTNAEFVLSLGAKFTDLTTNEEWKDGVCKLYVYKDDEDRQGRTLIDYCYITREEAENKDLILIWLDRQEDFLTRKEREYLKKVIRVLPHANEISGITKLPRSNDLYYYLEFKYRDGTAIDFPPFPRDEHYKDLKLFDFYTLDELELED